MEPWLIAILLLGLIVLSTVIGFLLRRSEGRVRVIEGPRVSPRVAGRDAWADRVTLLQFSTPTCSRCPATARMLADVADRVSPLPGDVQHVEVNLQDQPELASEWGITQTPTVFVLDGYGRVTARIGGPPKPADVESLTTTVLRSPRVDYSI